MECPEESTLLSINRYLLYVSKLKLYLEIILLQRSNVQKKIISKSSKCESFQ